MDVFPFDIQVSGNPSVHATIVFLAILFFSFLNSTFKLLLYLPFKLWNT